MSQEPTNAEILKVITDGQKRTDERLDAAQKHTDGRIDEVLEVVNDFSTKMDKRFDKVEEDAKILKTDVGYLKSNMVTKDDLDRALAKQKGEIVLLTRKGDIKLRELASILRDKQVLTPSEFEHIMGMEPFPQLFT